MLSDDERRAAAHALAEAERKRRPIEPLTTRWPSIDVVDAYEIQRLNIARRVEAGARVRGHKVGLSSRAMQQMMGVDESDYGHLLDDMFVFEGDRVATQELCTPRVEIEVAFVLGDALPGAGCNVADVIRATDFVLPAIEIIDSRIADWKIDLPDTIADNASSARLVLGGRPVRLEGIDIRQIGAVLRVNERVVETGAAAAVLGNPITAVAWLARKIHDFGVTLEAGHVVLPGSCTRAADVAAGDVVRADFDRLGSVEVGFA
ncbi:MAG: 2-keto-4-pentenoate hydratase [Deltaproteobacteria bacterium]|jgi:2-keto-4-pentenoate hydratase|nr:2-keto-4-pentenoate hydratase [Deltaproteobacteria bacterium]